MVSRARETSLCRSNPRRTVRRHDPSGNKKLLRFFVARLGFAPRIFFAPSGEKFLEPRLAISPTGEIWLRRSNPNRKARRCLPSGKYSLRSICQTWTRTKILASRGRCPTVRRSGIVTRKVPCTSEQNSRKRGFTQPSAHRYLTSIAGAAV